jgi:S1-C subfamily serine protease
MHPLEPNPADRSNQAETAGGTQADPGLGAGGVGKAELADAITVEPPKLTAALAAASPETTTNQVDESKTDIALSPPMPRGGSNRRGWAGTLIPLATFLAVVLLALYASPALLYRWRTVEAQAEAEAAYLHRRAELRAEAEAAERQLDLLDKRINLVSLGFREVVRKVAPNVVNVANYREPRAAEAVLLRKRSLVHDLDKDRAFVQAGVGSGIIVKPGYILTNDHVVRGAERLRITFASGQSLAMDAYRVASDPVTDLAVIRLPENLPEGFRAEVNVSTDFANSDQSLQVGDWVLAVGSPLGLKQTVTHGVISAKGRLLQMLDMVELLQTDAPINPGNSGGPLFDQYGRVAGINVAIASDTGVNQGIGFAIPSNTAKRIFERLVAKGEVVRGFIGIRMDDLPGDQARVLGLEGSGAVVVKEVLVDQAAKKAGLQVGDVIVRYNHEALALVNPVRHLRQRILDTDPGTQVTVEVLRDGARRVVQLEIGKRPNQAAVSGANKK